MFISFGYLSAKMIIPLLIPLLYSVRHYLLEEFDLNLKNPDNEEVKQQSVFLNTFIVSISYSINFILLIIEYNKTKSSRKKMQQKEFDNQLLIEKIKKEKKQRNCRFLILFLIPLFNFFNLLFYDILNIFKPIDYDKNYFYSLSIPTFFIITALMSFLLLNYKIYRHQKVAMIISPILSLSLLIILIIYNNKERRNGILYIILSYIEILGLRSLRYVLIVLAKLFMEKMFVSHIKLMTYLGIFGILFSLIANSISYLFNFNFIKNPNLNDFFVIHENKKRLKNIFDDWGYFDNLNCLIFIGIIILWFFERYIVYFCIYTFSPNHYTIYASISSILILFIEVIKLSDVFTIIFSSIALFGIFICGLIFNEIIIVRLWELDKYTNVDIDRRQKEETKISMIKYDDNNSNGEFPDNSFDSDMSDKIERNSTNL